MKLSKEKLIILVLKASPMKERFIWATLFFIWKRLEPGIDFPFTFKSSGLGPLAIGCGDCLYLLSEKNLVSMPTNKSFNSMIFSLTDAGKQEADKKASSMDTTILAAIESVACEMVNLSNSELISKMVAEAPAYFSPELASPDIRKKGLEILQSDQPYRFQEVSKLLGHSDKNYLLSYYQMGSMLGVTADHVKYLLLKDWRKKHQKETRQFEKSAKAAKGRILTSEMLGFSIWLPEDWNVVDEDNIKEDLSKPMLKMIDKWNGFSDSEKSENFRNFLVSLPKDNLALENTSENYFVDGKGICNRDYLEWHLKEMLKLKQKQGMRVGSWTADTYKQTGNESTRVEVVKFGLRKPMTALELYYAEKPSEQSIASASRPATRKDLIIDEMHAVKASCDLWDRKAAKPKLFASLFATYFTERLEGWAIDCWCEPKEKDKLRPLFNRIVSSFSRAR